MRFTLASFATAAVALACATSMVMAEKNSSDVSQFVDEQGNAIAFFEGTGDKDFADISRRSHARMNRRGKHSHQGHSRSTHATSGPDKGAHLLFGDTKITWYASHDLKNPQCGDGQWNPDNSCHIGAVMYGWQGGPECGEFVQLCNEKMDGNPCIRVRIVDKCEGCGRGHVDLTKSAFKQLAPSHSLNEGVVTGLKMYRTTKPLKWNLSLFGPFHLKG